MQRAKAPLIALIALGSLALSGCGAGMQTVLPTPPVLTNAPDCPAPERPHLPAYDGNLPFDAPENIEAMLERDDLLRLHIEALESTITCYRRKPKGKE
jgi:hypothetical protein